MRKLSSQWVQFALDFTVLSGAFIVAYLLRFDFRLSSFEEGMLVGQVPLILFVQFISLIIAGVYSSIWRYVGLREVGAFFKAMLWSTIILTLLRLLLPDRLSIWRIPLSIILMDAFLHSGAC